MMSPTTAGKELYYLQNTLKEQVTEEDDEIK